MKKLFFSFIMLSQFLVGCNQMRLYMREAPPIGSLSAAPDVVAVKILVPANNSFIIDNNQSAIPLGGTCTENGQPVSITVSGGSTLTFSATCTNLLWSIPIADLSSLSDGPVVMTADHQDTSGNVALTATKNYTKDTVYPTLTSVSSTTTTGTYGVGSAINVTLNFSEAMKVTGIPQISLNTSPARTANYVSGTGTSSLVFTYSVQAGDASALLDYLATSSIVLPGNALIEDVAGNDSSSPLPAPASGNDGLFGNSIVIDTTSLDVAINQMSGQSDPTSSLPIQFTAVFSQTIDPTTFTAADITNIGTATVGTWTITNPLNDQLNFVLSASGISASGTVIPKLNANTVQRLNGMQNTASTSTDHSVTYDVTAPTVVSVTSTTNTGYYSTGAVINVTVNFSEAVSVVGSPKISLNTTPAHDAVYTGMASPSSMTFEYTVQAGDLDNRVDYVSTTSLSLNGGTIQDASLNNAVLTLPAVGANGLYSKNIVIDAVPLTVTVNQGSSQSDPVNALPINFEVIFNKPINASTLTSADITHTGTATGLTWTVINSGNNQNFTFRVTAATANGTVVPSIQANKVTDLAGNNNLASTSTDNSVTYDTVAPTVTSVTTTTPTGYYNVGDIINVTVNFSEAVQITGLPRVALNTTPARWALFDSVSGSVAQFKYTVVANDVSARLDYTATSALALNGGTIKDLATNNAVLTLPSTGTNVNNQLYAQNIVIDATPLSVTVNQKPVGTQPDPTNNPVIAFDVVFNKPIAVATFTSSDLGQSGTATAGGWVITNPSNDQKNFVVTSASVSADGTVIPSISAGLVDDLAGNSNLSSTSTDASVTYDATAPTVLSVTSTTATGSYTTGAAINVKVNFSEPVTVSTASGIPSISLNTTPSRNASYVSGSATASLSFTYTVQANDVSNRLDYDLITALVLNGGLIRDSATNNAVLGLPPLMTNGLYGQNIVIDAVPLTVTVNQQSSQIDPTNLGLIAYDVIFNKAINGTTFIPADITHNGTATPSGWTISNPSGDLMNYVITTTAVTGNGTVKPLLTAGKVQDSANNNNLASTSTDNTVTYDTVAPTITSVTTTTPTGVYSTNSVINVRVNFSEPISIDNSLGLPFVTLNTTPSQNATFTATFGNSSIDFSYTVQAGDGSSRLDYATVSALVLNNSVIKDLANNSANPTLPTLASASDGLYGQDIEIETIPLAVTVNQILVQADPTKTVPIGFNVVFNEPIDPATFDVTDITNTGSANVTTWSLSNPSGDKINYVLNATAISSNGTVVPTIQAAKVKDLAGDDNTASTSTDNSVTYDTVSPTVLSVTTSSSTGTYSIGSVVNVTVNFDETVQVLTAGGSPQVALNVTNGTNTTRYATYVSGSNSTALSFQYTVQAGDDSPQLDYAATSSLQLNGGVIQDLATNAAVLTLPATGTSGLFTQNIVVDTTLLAVTVNQANSQVDPTNNSSITFDVVFSDVVNPSTFTSGDITNSGTATVSGWSIVNSGDDQNFTITTTGVTGNGTVIPSISANQVQDPVGNNNLASTSNDNSVTYDTVVPTIASVTTTTATGSYTTGATVNVTVNFSEAVNVTGIPEITLNTTPSRKALYASGSGTTALVFTYTVIANDASNRLDYVNTTSLSTAGGSISDLATNSANLTLPATGTNGLYNQNIIIDATPLSLTVNQGGSQLDPTNSALITYAVVFNKPINPSTFTAIDIVNSASATAVPTGWTISNPSNDLMNYTITTTGVTGNGTVMPTVLVNTVKDSVGNDNLASTSTDHSVTYDSVAPTVLTVTSTTSSGNYTTGAVINVTVNFSEPITVNSSGGTPVIALNTTPARNANYVSSSGNSAVFEYTVQAGDVDTRVDYTTINALALSGGTIKDAAGNNATLTLPAVASSGLYNQNIVVDASALTVTVNQKSTQPDPTNVDQVAFDVVFNKAITVSSFTAVDLTNAGTSSVNGWTITNPSNDQKTFVVTTTGLTGQGTVIPSLAVSTVQDPFGNQNNASTSTDNSVTYDSVAPTVLSVTTTKPTGTYSTGTVIDVTVTFTETVSSTGSPSIGLNTTPARNAVFSSGSGSSVTFQYTVQSGDASNRLDYALINSLVLNGGTILDSAGNSASLTLPSVGTSGLYTQNLVIDSSAPSVTVNQKLVQADPTSALPIEFDVTFSEPINASSFTTADITQAGTSTGITWQIVNSGNNQNYVLRATAVGTDGTVKPTIAGSAVQDPGGNNNGASTSTDNTVTYDTTPPTVLTVTSTTASGTYTTAQNINVTVNFSEVVNVTTTSGIPTVALNTTPARSASYVSGSGSNALVFTYSIQAGDSSNRIDYVSTNSLVLNSGIIQDGALNNATLTLPATTSSGLYGNDIKVDTTAPTVTITSTSTANPTLSSAVPMTVTFSETVTGFTSGDLSITGGTLTNFVAVSGLVYTFDFVPTTNTSGTFTIDVPSSSALDSGSNGNTAATQFSRNYYRKDPSVTGTSPTNDTTPNLTVSNIISSLSIQLHAGSCSGTQMASGTSSGTSLVLTSGTISSNTTYFAKALDSEGNSICSTSGFALVLDTTPPTIAITSPTGGNVSVSQVFSGTCSEAGMTVFIHHDTIPGSVGSGTCNGTSFSVTVDTSSWPEANGIDINASISDQAGNTTYSNIVIVDKDSTPPANATSLSWTPSSQYSTTTSLSASWVKSTSLDLASQKIQFFSDGTCATPTGSLINLSSTAQSQSLTGTHGTTYSYQITSVDATGNSSTSGCSSSKTVDTVAPNAPTNLDWLNGAPTYQSTTNLLTATWTVSNSGDLANQKIQFYVGPCVSSWGGLVDLNSSTQSSYAFTSASNGTFSYKVTSIDFAGNSSVSACSQTMQVAVPPLKLYPKNFNFAIGNNNTVQFVASEGSGSGYAYSIVSGPGTIDPNTGVYTGGTSRIPGTTTVVRVTDSSSQTVDRTITHQGLMTNGIVYTTATDNNNKLYLGGDFTSVFPDYASSIVKISPTDGSNIDQGISSGFNVGAMINAAVISGNDIYIGGSFTSYHGTSIQNLAKINRFTGELDTTFTLSTGPNAAVNALAINGTSLYVGGDFTGYRATTGLKYLIKVDTTSGALDTGFPASPTYLPNNSVYALLYANSSLYVGGAFTMFAGGATGNSLVKLSPTGNSLTYLLNLTVQSGTVYALATDGSSLYVGGAMANWRNGSGTSDASYKNLLKLDMNTGALIAGFNLANNYPNAAVRALALSSDNLSLYAGGLFTTYRGSTSGQYLVKVSASTGVMDTAFNSSATNIPNSYVYALHFQDSYLYAGGNFTKYRGLLPGKSLVKVNPSTGVMETTNFHVNSEGGVSKSGGATGTIKTIVGDSNGIFMGGDFNYYRGLPAVNLAKVSASNWQLDTAFTHNVGTKGTNGIVRTVVTDGTSVYAGGEFTTYRGSANGNRIIKLDPSTGNMDASFNSGTTGPSDTVYSMVLNGSTLWAAGAFTSYRGDSKGCRFIKLDATTGGLDYAFNSASSKCFNNTVYTIALRADSKAMFCGGAFTTFNGSSYAQYFHPISLDASTGVAINSQMGTLYPSVPNNIVYSIKVHDSSTVYIGGDFTNYGSSSQAVRIAKLNATNGALITTFNSTTTGPNATVYAIDTQSTSVYIGGAFTNYRGDAKGYHLARINASTSPGTLETSSFHTVANQGPSGNVYSIIKSYDLQKLFVSGDFIYRNQITSPNFVPINLSTGDEYW